MTSSHAIVQRRDKCERGVYIICYESLRAIEWHVDTPQHGCVFCGLKSFTFNRFTTVNSTTDVLQLI